ncbi:MAG: hypothetical protein OEV21_01225 [Thermoplasmata archaeon]|nr:hypothetical protein [Thermoplasmata archaeon]
MAGYQGPTPLPNVTQEEYRPTDKRSERKKSGPVGKIISTIIAVLIIILFWAYLSSPLLSPFSTVHDSDGDGHADYYDNFPNDSNFWRHSLYNLSIDESSTQYSWILTVSLADGRAMKLSEIGILINDTEGHTILPFVVLSNLISDSNYNGITFVDSINGFFNSGDQFILDKSIYQSGSILRIIYAHTLYEAYSTTI